MPIVPVLIGLVCLIWCGFAGYGLVKDVIGHRAKCKKQNDSWT